MEKTRWFLVMRIKKPPNNELNRLLQVTNDVVTACGQSPLYVQHEPQAIFPPVSARNPTTHEKKRQQAKLNSKYQESPLKPSPKSDMSLNFHISIGWTLSAPSEGSSSMRRTTKADNQMFEFQLPVKALKLKIGNSVTSISLLPKTEMTSGILEA